MGLTVYGNSIGLDTFPSGFLAILGIPRWDPDPSPATIALELACHGRAASERQKNNHFYKSTSKIIQNHPKSSEILQKCD